ncbi:unnamed protein product, partial [Adineta steineri]
DMNGDNNQEIIVANPGSNTVGVLLSTGNGTFLSQTSYSVGSSPHSVAVGDVNNDNKIDIVAANYGTTTISILLHC